jgi:hypothetical protein
MDRLEFSKLPLSPGEREKLIQLYAERFRRFRERADQPPHDIEKCDYEELIIGPLRDLLSLLLDIEATPEQREQWLREHAIRILNDPDAQRLALEVAKKYLRRAVGSAQDKDEDYFAFAAKRKWRIFQIDKLIEELNAQNGGSFGKTPMPKLPEPNRVLEIESSSDSPNAEETAPSLEEGAKGSDGSAEGGAIPDVEGNSVEAERRAKEAERRAKVDMFISRVGKFRAITRKDIWTVGNYKDPTEFERWQRAAERTTESANQNFTRVLNMTPESFIAALKTLEEKAAK